MTDLLANDTEFTGPITLTAAVDADDTSFAFSGTIPASLRNGTSRWRVGRTGSELVIATINSGGTSPMTVVRGAEGSTAVPVAAGTRLWNYFTKAQLGSGGGSSPDADASTKGLVQLAGDFGGTAASPTVPGLAAKASTSALSTHTVDTANPHGVTKTQVGLGSADNTADTAKPVSTAQQTALDAKAPLASPVFTGNPTAPTATPGDNDTSIATTAYVQTEAGLLIPKSLVDAKGDLLVGTADNTVTRKAVSTADGTALVADSVAADGLSYAQFLPPVATGQYLYIASTASSPNSQGSGSAVLGQLVVPRRQTFDRMSVSIQTAATGNVRLLIYADSNGKPGALVLDAGTVAVGTTGIKEATINQSLPAGLYWVGPVSETTAGTVAWTAVSGSAFTTNQNSVAPGIVLGTAAWYKGGITTGAPPNPFGAPGGSTNLAPIIGLRAV